MYSCHYEELPILQMNKTKKPKIVHHDKMLRV